MCLKQKSTIIEKACKEINTLIMQTKGIKYIAGYKILKEEVEPIVNKVTQHYDLNPEIMFKRLDIR